MAGIIFCFVINLFKSIYNKNDNYHEIKNETLKIKRKPFINQSACTYPISHTIFLFEFVLNPVLKIPLSKNQSIQFA